MVCPDLGRKEKDEQMAHLTLAGLSEDGRRLLLVSDTGVEFTLDVDTNETLEQARHIVAT